MMTRHHVEVADHNWTWFNITDPPEPSLKFDKGDYDEPVQVHEDELASARMAEQCINMLHSRIMALEARFERAVCN
jgi:hypothetical protein